MNARHLRRFQQNIFTTFMAGSSNVLQSTVLKSAEAVWKGFSVMSSEISKPRTLKRIGTHSGTFHCDEALGCYMLQLLPEFKDSEIIRTRDNEVLKTCDVVIDVGGIYDPNTNRFDHHQRSFNHTLSTVLPDLAQNKKIRLSSAGLIYAHYGMNVISELLSGDDEVELTSDCIKNIFMYVYDTFMEEIDAIDNGVPLFEGNVLPSYKIYTHLGARVNRLNSAWNETIAESTDALFKKAIDMAGSEFKSEVLHAAKVWWPARDIVKKAVKQRESAHVSGTIVLLPEFCPWIEHLFKVEEELKIQGELKYIVFRDSNKGWRVRSIPIAPDSFVNRLSLHEKWRGLRDQELSNVVGLGGCIFCHANGFIAGHETREGAIEMAVKSLKAGLVTQ